LSTNQLDKRQLKKTDLQKMEIAGKNSKLQMLADSNDGEDVFMLGCGLKRVITVNKGCPGKLTL